ncbi:hypothetical protein ABTW51_09210 [Serratia nematodiphila]
MSTEKLSELSKPVAWTDERGNLCTNRNKERGLESRYHQDYEKYTTPFYSQEYVSALKHESAVNWEAAASLNVENQELKKRIAELEAIRSDASQVFKEIGNELGCNPDNESIMMAIDALKERLKLVREQRDNELRANAILEKRLTTPVRLLGEMLAHDWEHSTERQATFQHRKIAWDARLAEDKKAILAAGFTFTVEGDE